MSDKKLDQESIITSDVFTQCDRKGKAIINRTSVEITSTVRIEEFSSFCPLTGYPDYASLLIEMVAKPEQGFPEMKDFRDWLNRFRNIDGFQEEITAAIAEYIKNTAGCSVLVIADWKGRGGMTNKVVVRM